MKNIGRKFGILFLTVIIFVCNNITYVEASPLTTYEGVDYEIVFDAKYYAQMNSDVVSSYGNNELILFYHFILHGMKEGRVASKEFNVADYVANNPELVTALGTDSLVPYYLHYITEGRAEGRIGSNLSVKQQSQEIYNKIIALKSIYPEGTSWTNENIYISKTGDGGAGCHGFALIASDAAFDDAPRHWCEKSVANIEVGDVLRVNNNTHSVVVLEVHGNHIVVAEGNYNKSIHWGRTITKSELEASLDRVWCIY